MEYLEAEGHTTAHVVDVFEPGIDDPDIATWAHENDYIILTKDTDFLQLPEDEHTGVLFDPNGRFSAYTMAAIVLAIAEQHDRDDLQA